MKGRKGVREEGVRTGGEQGEGGMGGGLGDAGMKPQCVVDCICPPRLTSTGHGISGLVRYLYYE
jgi:hypothetical protein